jgi:hypothetical protein
MANQAKQSKTKIEDWSKPIEIIEEKTSFLDKIRETILGPKLQITFWGKKKSAKTTDSTAKTITGKETPSSPTSPATSAEKILKPTKSAADSSGQVKFTTPSHSETSNSKLVKEVFASEAPQIIQLPKTDFGSSGSVSWVISGSLTVIILVVVILSSFGLINLLKNQFVKQNLSDTQIDEQKAEQLYQAGNYQAARDLTKTILDKHADDTTANNLLTKINASYAKNVLDQFIAFRQVDLTSWTHDNYQDPKGHFAIGIDPNWTTLNSNYDLKLAGGTNQFGVRKYSAVRSINDLKVKFQANLPSQTSLIYTQDDYSFQNSTSSVLVLEDADHLIVSLLCQKYYFGYELTAWLPKDNYQTGLADFTKFVASYQLLPNFDLSSYNDLATFDGGHVKVHSWPGVLTQDDQAAIATQFSDSISYINQNLITQYANDLQVYLYPSWDTLYEYTLATNSFSDFNNSEIHIVYTDANNHQSFGYETTKIVVQHLFGQVSEPLLLNGLATMLDQTGRDYRSLAKVNAHIPLANLLGVGWEVTPGDPKYYEAGTFTQYLISRYGIDVYINLLQEKTFPEAFDKHYSKSLADLEKEYLDDLNSGSNSDLNNSDSINNSSNQNENITNE